MSSTPPCRADMEALDNEALYRWAVLESHAYAQHVFRVRFEPLLQLVALRIVGEKVLAHEVAADVLRRVLMQQHPLAVQSVSSLLNRITRNTALTTLEQLGRRRRYEKTVGEFTESSLQNVELLTNDSLVDIDQALLPRLQQALQRLRPEQCKALELFYFHDLNYVAIASQLAIPVETVKSHLQNGRKRLRHLLSRA